MSQLEKLNKQWLALCADIAEEARRQGAEDPFIFACESGLCVLDGPPFDSSTSASRWESILFTLPTPPVTVIAFDTGGW